MRLMQVFIVQFFSFTRCWGSEELMLHWHVDFNQDAITSDYLYCT